MDYKFYISIYAAIISTVVFAWRLYEFYYDRRGKLKVTNMYVTQIPVYNGTCGDSKSYLLTTIINRGKSRRLIEKPRYQSNIKINGENLYDVLDVNIKEKYPVAIEPGEKHEYKVPFESIDEYLIKQSVQKIKTLIIDTYGKTYRSNWFVLKI